ncbi:MAG: hypothetical protein H7336_00085 [Bacteriovorax sp.]|nr:hypothetical protein [Bacteriovorax sp.]
MKMCSTESLSFERNLNWENILNIESRLIASNDGKKKAMDKNAMLESRLRRFDLILFRKKPMKRSIPDK